MNEKQGTAYHLPVFKEEGHRERKMFLEKRHGKRKVKKLKGMARHLHAGMHPFLSGKLMQHSNFTKPCDTLYICLMVQSRLLPIRLTNSSGLTG